MRKLLTLTLLAFSITFCTYAQNTVRVGGGGDLAFNQGDKIVQVGLGLGRAVGRYGYGWGYSGLGASLNGAFEIGVHEYFSVGPYVAFGRYNYGYSVAGFGRENYNLTAIAAGARGTFHYTPLFNEIFETSIDEEKIDLYISVLLGLEFISSNLTIEGSNVSEVGFDGGAVFGGRYKFNPRIAVFTELGYSGLSVWTIGASFHF